MDQKQSQREIEGLMKNQIDREGKFTNTELKIAEIGQVEKVEHIKY